MSGNSTIEWTEKTWNPLRARVREDVQVKRANGLKVIPAGTWGYHCERVSPGCKHCYACTMNGRTLPAWGTGLDYAVPNRPKVEIYLDQDQLEAPLRWRGNCTVFVCSMTDLFGEFVPEGLIRQMFRVMQQTPNHTYQVLTKRAERMETLMPHVWEHLSHFAKPGEAFDERWIAKPLRNVWLGVSVESRPYLRRIDHLLETTAAVRFASLEPLLEDLGDISGALMQRCPECGNEFKHGWRDCPTPECDGHPKGGLDWIITGAESGTGATPMNEAWVRRIKDQCVKAAVPFFYKQKAVNGRKIATPELDGRTWMEMPQ